MSSSRAVTKSVLTCPLFRRTFQGGGRLCIAYVRALPPGHLLRGLHARTAVETNNSNRDAAHRTRMKTDQSQHDADGKLKNGVFKEYFKDGTLACVGKNRNGEKIGEWKYYLRNGLLKAIGRFSNGKMTGGWKWYRESGKLMQTGSFDDEKKVGTWKRYHPTGALYDEGETFDR